jgi:sugar lactone lactonase YvrE
MSDAVCVLDAKASLGESPVWCPEQRALYWVDINEPAIHVLHPDTGATRRWTMPEQVGCIALRRTGGIVAGLRTGFAFVDPQTGTVTPLHNPEPGRPGNRLNDGRCDRRGRFWAGSIVDSLNRPDGGLYRFDPDRSCRQMVDGIGCSNGLAWSPDDRIMYHADSRAGAVWAYDFDADAGTIANRRLFAEPKPGEGLPDGAAVDAEGCYWSARYDGWRLVRHAPDGREILVVAMPVQLVTMCAFGGDRLDVLYVTSARQRLSPEQLAKQPQAGGIFALDIGVRGLPEPRFAG